MMHALAVELLMLVAKAMEEIGGEDVVIGLGFLQAQDVGLVLGDQASDQRGPGPHRVDVPRSDLQPSAHVRRLPCPGPSTKRKAPAPGAWSEGRPSVRHARDSADPG